MAWGGELWVRSLSCEVGRGAQLRPSYFHRFQVKHGMGWGAVGPHGALPCTIFEGGG